MLVGYSNRSTLQHLLLPVFFGNPLWVDIFQAVSVNWEGSQFSKAFSIFLLKKETFSTVLCKTQGCKVAWEKFLHFFSKISSSDPERLYYAEMNSYLGNPLSLKWFICYPNVQLLRKTFLWQFLWECTVPESFRTCAVLWSDNAIDGNINIIKGSSARQEIWVIFNLLIKRWHLWLLSSRL